MAKKKTGLSARKLKKAIKGPKKSPSGGLWDRIEKQVRKADHDDKGKRKK